MYRDTDTRNEKSIAIPILGMKNVSRYRYRYSEQKKYRDTDTDTRDEKCIAIPIPILGIKNVSRYRYRYFIFCIGIGIARYMYRDTGSSVL